MKQKILLKDVAYEEIKKKILYENVRHMSENSLVEELNMSRTPIREALFRLQHEGFLQIISNQGIVVNDISVNRLEELIDMRVAIETFSLKQASSLITESDYSELHRIIKEQKEACENNDTYRFRELDAEFHKYLLTITDNYYFMKMFSEVYELQFTARKKHLPNEEMKKLIKEHENIINCLIEADIEQAINVLTQHLNDGKR